MNYLEDYSRFESQEQAFEQLKKDVKLFNSLGGDVYKNAVYDDLKQIQRHLEKRGFDSKKIYLIMSGQE